MRSTLSLLGLLGWGCGRIAFDLDGDAADATDAPGAALELVQAATTIDVIADGRFSLRFAASHDWACIDWRDAITPQDPLVASSAIIDRAVLQGILAKPQGGSEFVAAGDATAKQLEVIVEDPQHVVLRATLGYASAALDVVIENRIGFDGIWEITTSITSSSVGELNTLELADSHVNDELTWTLVSAPAGYRWRRTGTAPQPTVNVTAPVGIGASDEPNNRYYTVSSVLLPTTQSWVVTLWPPS